MNYQFKVGDKGKTTTGHDYEIVAELVPPLEESSFVVHMDGDKFPYFRSKCGTADPNLQPTCGDLLPPTRTVYVNLYHSNIGRHTPEDSWWTQYDTPELAVAGAMQGAVAIAVPVEIQG